MEEYSNVETVKPISKRRKRVEIAYDVDIKDIKKEAATGKAEPRYNW